MTAGLLLGASIDAAVSAGPAKSKTMRFVVAIDEPVPDQGLQNITVHHVPSVRFWRLHS